MQGKNVAKMVISIIIIIAFSIVLLLTATIHFKLNQRVKYLEKNCTQTATGEVYTDARHGVELILVGNIVGAEFTLDGNQYHAGGLDEGSHNRGEEVICHYNPKRPQECYAGVKPSLVNMNLISILYGGSIFAILGAVITLIFAIKSSKD